MTRAEVLEELKQRREHIVDYLMSSIAIGRGIIDEALDKEAHLLDAMWSREAMVFDLSLGCTKPAPEPGEPMKSRKYTPYTQDAKQYGEWRFYDPTRVGTLSEALDKLGRMLMDTVRDHGQPNGLQWIVHDLKEQWPILPNELENIKRPAGCTCTVGWKAHFEGTSHEEG